MNGSSLDDAPVYAEMVERNMIGMPIVTFKKVDGELVDGSRNSYSLFREGQNVFIDRNNAHPYPYNFERYETTWDENGNIEPIIILTCLIKFSLTILPE